MGLHQVQFSVITDVLVGDPHEVANDSPQIEICQLLSSVSHRNQILQLWHPLVDRKAVPPEPAVFMSR